MEPPDIETCAAILIRKADDTGVRLPEDVAFFIAKSIRSNVRELEGALRRVLANSQLTGASLSIDFVRESLRDLLAIQSRLVTIENIQKAVAEYYKVRLSDLLSPSRTRSLARPRQVAMSLSKELTRHSLPEIGEAFGGRDHGTVIHAVKTVENMMEQDNSVRGSVDFLKTQLTK